MLEFEKKEQFLNLRFYSLNGMADKNPFTKQATFNSNVHFDIQVYSSSETKQKGQIISSSPVLQSTPL